jgi:uroporphyrinogen-III synthase
VRQVVILRPEPGASRTAAKARALGLEPVLLPLFAPEPLPWNQPAADEFDALLLTSANGVRMAGAGLDRYRILPAYAVGEATAQALRDAGFADVTAGTGDGNAIAARVRADGRRRVLHLAGTTVAPMDISGLSVRRISVYSMASLISERIPTEQAGADAILLVHSPRAGERLSMLLPPARRNGLHVVAISAAALAASGDGWASGHAAARPDDDEMLALARRLCE